MFGYVKPFIPELKVGQHELYKSVYCTLCRRQKELTGFFSSFYLSYDFVFLALLRGSIMGDKYCAADSRCAYNPLKKKKNVEACRSIDYTACAATLLTYYKLKDDVDDGRGFEKIKKWVAMCSLKKAKKRAIKLYSLPEEYVYNKLKELSELESSGGGTLDGCAHIFGEILSAVSSSCIDDEMQEFVLEKLFYHVGRWIYIIDAIDDYPDDLKKGNFNPLLNDGINCDLLDNCLQGILSEIDRYLLKIKFADDGIFDIIKNIVYLGTDAVAKNVFSTVNDSIDKMKGSNK